MAYTPIGPTRILVGNPTTAAGAGMSELVDTENVSIDLGIKLAYTSNAVRQGAAYSDSIYYMTPEPMASVELKDAEVTTLELLILNGVIDGGNATMGFGDAFTHIATGGVSDLPTVVFVPETEKDPSLGSWTVTEDAPHAIWFPRAYFSGVSGIQYGRVSEGEINQPYSIEIRATYADVDQASQPIDVQARMGFMGPPGNVITEDTTTPLPWNLPTIT